ncbi:pyridoxamine 5'-phosphate oxidase-like protein [Mycobacteroides abscessus subsp. abscessus]|nr:pyridoxamine 5'-phosphate oxidase-like protein [Mycobacteroides abscessus subsp. abscessus]
MAQRLGGYPDATEARCEGADRYGLDIRVSTPRGWSVTRVGYAEPIDSIEQLRGATVQLARLADPRA